MPYTNLDSENLTDKAVKYLYHHLFLPAELPDGDDGRPEDERLLMGFVHHSLESFLVKTDPEAGAAIKACSAMIERLQKSKNAHGFLSAGGVQSVLQQLSLEVVATRGRLVRRFPANATEISCRDLEDEDFQAALAKTLAKMSHQTVEETKHKVKKAKQEHPEDRETVHPRIVVDLLPGILRGAGEQVSVTGISKNTHEEVMWSNSKLPWRRSPL
ncbi:hypothetical protein CEP54_015728 [Fusarium duplospermum]|uniref:DUF6606 domain-containing protein n=1 Tax=Fusarium duplospermum TaxID=1325734 RepID=A0A428NLT5_9HYPO|nr:hypothetical protein CEP54_015728 [Fusarium duplospermum]